MPKTLGKDLTRVNLSHVRAQCPSRVSVESRAESELTVGIQMCDRAKRFASDEHDVELMGDGRPGLPMQIRSGASKRTNPHLNRTRQPVDHLLPL